MHMTASMTTLKIISKDGTESTLFINDRYFTRLSTLFINSPSYNILEGASSGKCKKGGWQKGSEPDCIVHPLVGGKSCCDNGSSE
jgi:hypothetical protein